MSVTISLHTPDGSVFYVETVLASIVGIAAMDNGGIFETNPNKIGDSISKLLGKSNMKQGVEILKGKEDSAIKITMHVSMVYGNNLLTVAQNIRRSVKSAIESMTGLKVEETNVYIDEVRGTEHEADTA